MLKLVVAFSSNRDFEGKIHLEQDGRLLAGPFAVCGRADEAAAQRHGNPDRNPLLPFGDTPLGFYRVVGLLPSGGGTALPKNFFGPHSVVVLKPTGGDAALADANGRFNTLIQGGQEGPGGRLLPTNGSLRLRDKDQKKLLRALAAQPGADCECEMTVAAVQGKPVGQSVPYELGDPLSGQALNELRRLVMASMFVIGTSWNMIHGFNPSVFKYLATSSRFHDILSAERFGKDKTGSLGSPSGGGGPFLWAGDGYPSGESSTGAAAPDNGSSGNSSAGSQTDNGAAASDNGSSDHSSVSSPADNGAADNSDNSSSTGGSTGGAMNQLKTLNSQGEGADFDGRNNNSSSNSDNNTTTQPEAPQQEQDNSTAGSADDSDNNTQSQTTDDQSQPAASGGDESQSQPSQAAAPDESNENLESGDSSSAPPPAADDQFQVQTAPADSGNEAASGAADESNAPAASNAENQAPSSGVNVPVVDTPAQVSNQEVEQLNTDAGSPSQVAGYMAQGVFSQWKDDKIDDLQVETAKQVMESTAGKSEGVESAFSVAKIVGNLKAGKNDAAAAGTMEMGIGFIPLPGVGVAMAAHKVPGAMAQGAFVKMIQQVNVFFDSMGSPHDTSIEAAQDQYDEMMKSMTFGQRTISYFTGMKNDDEK